MSRQLYYSPGACSLAPHILLEEAHLPYELVLTAVNEGATSSPGFLAINPKARVPVLVEDREVITELPAICWHVAARSEGLLPRSPLALVRALEWFNWLSGTVHGQGFGALWRPGRFTPDSALHPALTEHARITIAQSYDAIEARLRRSQWALGDEYSLVDPYLLVLYRWGVRIDLPMRARHPAWTAHTRAMLQRAAVKQSFAQEGLDIAQLFEATAESVTVVATGTGRQSSIPS